MRTRQLDRKERIEAMLENKNAVIYGGGGAIGGEVVAHAFAREGARVFLAGRTLAKVEAVAKEITEAGGVAEAAQVDALDEQAVEKHIVRVAETTARIAVGVAFIRRQRKLADPLQEQKPEAARSRIDGTTEGWRRATR